MATGTFASPNTAPLTPASGSHLPPDNLSHYDIEQIAILAHAAGFNYDQVPIAAAIAMAESSGNPTATNDDSNGTHDVGLWQINSSHGYSDSEMENPYYNAAAAKVVFDSQGWGAWSTYNSGAYRQFDTPDLTLKELGDVETGSDASTVSLPGGAAQQAVQNVGGAFGNVAGLVGNLTSGAFWFTVLKILGGLALIVIGAILLLKGSGNTNVNLAKAMPVE